MFVFAFIGFYLQIFNLICLHFDLRAKFKFELKREISLENSQMATRCFLQMFIFVCASIANEKDICTQIHTQTFGIIHKISSTTILMLSRTRENLDRKIGNENINKKRQKTYKKII